MESKSFAGSWHAGAVFLLALVALGWGSEMVSIANSFADPISKIRVQDESFYSHNALQMAVAGDWMTPTFLGRYFLHKPPLLMWLSGLSMKCFGVSLLTLRLPVLLAGALVVTLVFWWVWQAGSAGMAVAAAILLVSNRLWHTYSRLCMTDVLLTAWIVAALSCLAKDPRLAGRASLCCFGAFTAAALMTKNIAGLLPLFILVVFQVWMRGDQRPGLRRILGVSLLAGGLALPWHLYQLVAHRQWFWTEYVKVQIFGIGLHSSWQGAREGQLWFYLKRLAMTDPVLCVLVLVALPSFWVALRRRDSVRPVLLVCWILVAAGSIALFQAQNLVYVSYLIPALSILAGGYGPWRGKARQSFVIAALGILFVVKAGFGAQAWGLPFLGEKPNPSAQALRSYCDRGRPNELIVVSSDDDFYSAVLPLPKVRYCFIGPLSVFETSARHLIYLGVVVTADQFAELDRWRPQFRERLLSWGLDSTEPLGSAIVAASEAEVVKIIEGHPETDFFLPVEMRGMVEAKVRSTHEAVTGTSDRFFLLALTPAPAREARRPLPRYW